MSVTREQVAKVLEITSDDKDVLTLSKGVFTRRKEYYWTPRKTPEESFFGTLQTLQHHFEVQVIDYGDHYTSFRGGESVKKNSHYWFKFKLKEKKPAE